MRIYILSLLLICMQYAAVAQSTNEANLNVGKVKFNAATDQLFVEEGLKNLTSNRLLWSIADSAYYVFNGIAWVKLLDTKQGQLDTVFAMEYNICTFKKQTDRFSDYARDGNMTCQLGKYFYSFGGWNPVISSGSDNQIYRSSGNLSKWEKLPNAPWAHRHCFGLVTKNDTAFIFGGDMIGDYSPDCWAATADSSGNLSWHLLNGNMPWGKRVMFGSCLHNNAIYVLGGQNNMEYDKGVCNDVWRSYDGKKWERVANNLPQFGKNMAGTSISFNGYIYVVAGGKYHNNKAYKTYDSQVWRSKNGVDWERLPDAPFRGKQFPNTVVYDNRLFVFFGSNDDYVPSNSKAIWYLDQNLSWHKVHNPAIPGRHACGLNTFTDEDGKENIVIVAGNMWNDVWVGKMTDSNEITQYASVITTKRKLNITPTSTLWDKFHPIKHPYRAMIAGFIALILVFTTILFIVNRYFVRRYMLRSAKY